MNNDPRYIEAKRYVEATKGFYVHFTVFAVVMTGLLGINLLDHTEWWVQWPLMGWGLGVIGHGIAVFMPAMAFGHEWEERRVKARIAKMSALAAQARQKEAATSQGSELRP